MKMKRHTPPGSWLSVFAAGGLLLAALAARPTAAAAQDDTPGRMLNYRDAPLDIVLATYAELTGRTLISAPGVNATVTLRSQAPLSKEEFLQAIDTALALQNIAIVPMGEKFLKVVQTTAVRQEGLPIQGYEDATNLPPADVLVSQIVELRHLSTTEVQPILQGLLHAYGKIQPLERANSLLVTDTAANLQRVMQILEYLDRPATSRVETRVYELHFAEAGQVAARINELIAESQQAQAGAAAGRTVVIQTPPGVIRARPAAAATATEIDMAERGLVTGKVKIVADERTNILIVIAEPTNFLFFDKIVAVLDRAVEPEVLVRVYPLEYASAEETAAILNSFLGNATDAGSPAAAPPPAAGDDTAESRSQALRDFIAQRLQARQPDDAGNAAAGIGELSANTKVLADKRSNALLLMGRRSDIAALEDVIRQLDVMLAQVLIEAVILEVNLSDNTGYGIDWLQRSLLFMDDAQRGGLTLGTPVAGYGGGFAGGSNPSFLDGGSVDRNVPLNAGALTYYLTLYDLNLDAVIRMVAASSDARILSTPVVMTTDNTEAQIVAGEERPVVTTTSVTTGGTQTSQYEYKNIGIQLTVTPRINPERVVVMDITQTADNVGDIVQIDGNEVPVITKRELKASIAVPDRATIALGGLVSKATRKGRTKVPLLGDIPILGWLFRSQDKQDTRSELLVLITPYVIVSPAQARAETRRLHTASGAAQTDWYGQWSDGDLARELRREDHQQVELRRRRTHHWFWEEDAAPAEDEPGRGPAATAPDTAAEADAGAAEAPADREAPADERPPWTPAPDRDEPR